MSDRVIAAIATAFSPAGIGIIRLSGAGSIDIADKIFVGKKKLSLLNSHEMAYGHIVKDDEIIDEVLVSVMKAPRSYTTEDVVEINCHGGIFILKKILGMLYANGAHPAKPGEFTMRAFLNGRIDLSQAESVMEMISSQNEVSLQNSIKQLSGNFSGVISNIRRKLLYEIAFIETAIDDPEHFSLDNYPKELEKKLLDINKEINKLIKSSQYGSILKEGVPTAIIGQVNVGKSSLLNALSGWDKAIVTDIPGTTRDTIEESIRIGDIILKITDTAGIRESEDPVEKIGIEKSIYQLENTGLIILMIDSTKELDKVDIDLIKKTENKKAIICLNKCDLEKKVDSEDIIKYSKHPVIEISAKNLSGITRIGEIIEDIYYSKGIEEQADFYVTNERHFYLLEEAKNSIELVLKAISDGMAEDFYSIDLTAAYSSLGKILGKEVEDDVVETIFSKFCIGK